LVERYEEGIGYSAMNTTRSALSTIIVFGNITAGAHPLVIRFLKGVYNLRPPQARYVTVWDPTIVLNYLKGLGPAKSLGIKDLTLKLVTLMALVSAQRAQSLHLLNTKHMKRKKNLVTFRFSKPLKQCRPGISNPILEFKAYVPNRRICVVTYIEEYLQRTKPYRANHSQFFLSYSKKHNPVSKSTISRWIKTTLYKAGIQQCFTAHSTRTASTSSAFYSAVPIEDILKQAGWSSDLTFAKYYKKPIQGTAMSDTLLSKA
jgi:hypothetical protein